MRANLLSSKILGPWSLDSRTSASDNVVDNNEAVMRQCWSISGVTCGRNAVSSLGQLAVNTTADAGDDGDDDNASRCDVIAPLPQHLLLSSMGSCSTNGLVLKRLSVSIGISHKFI